MRTLLLGIAIMVVLAVGAGAILTGMERSTAEQYTPAASVRR